MRIGKFSYLLSLSHGIECRCGHDSVPALKAWQLLNEEAFRVGGRWLCSNLRCSEAGPESQGWVSFLQAE